jgi:NHLM bacteriocin system ABC transporter ATP-binding protein
MKQYFMDNGIRTPLDAKSPLSLANSSDLWFVAQGRVDVFLVESRTPLDRCERTCAFSVEKDQAFFGHAGDSGPSLVAVGTPGTEVYRLSRAKAAHAEPETLARLVDDYLDTLARAMARGIEVIPEAEAVLRPGTHLDVPRLTVARARNETVWVRHASGAALFMGMEDVGSHGEWYPVMPQAWIQPLHDVTMELRSTAAMLRDDVFWQAFDQCQEMALNCFSLAAAFGSADRLVALREKMAANVRVTRGGLLKLASIMDCSIKAPVGHDAEDALARACSMVARHIGVELSAKQAPLAGETVEDIAESGAMRARRVLLRGNWHREDGGPLVAFTAQDRRPVALIPTSPKAYALHDPGDDSIRPVTGEMLDELDLAAYSLYRPLPARKLSMRDIPLFGLRGSWRDLAWVCVLGAVLGLAGLITPLLTRTIFNDIIPGAERGRLLQVVAILLGFTVASLLFEVTKSIAMLRAKARTDHNLETAIWERLLRLPVRFFRKFTAGDLAQRAMALNSVQQLLSGASLSSMFSAMFSLIFLAQLFYFDTKLALLALGITLVSALATALVSAIQIRYQRKAVGLAGKISGQTLQFITGVSKLRAGGAEDRALMLWAEDFAEQRRISYKLSTIGNAFSAFNTAFATIGSALIFIGVVYFERETDMDMGTFIAFWAAFGGLQGGILSLVGAVTQVFHAIPYYERLKPIIEEAPEDSEAKGDPGKITGNIELSNLNFRYADDGPMLLRNVSFRVKPGEFVAITGPSGSGKTTLLRLLLGFETPQSGSILFDNQDLSQLDAAKVRKQMGVVLQDGGLMPGDIFTNIIGASTLTIDDAWRAAKMAGFDKDIKEMPMGMHTVISEGASTLSGGQKQRLIIARALARNPKVLLFDEATSALDNRTQEIVTQSLNQLPVARIVIAHRLSTIRSADTIIVLKDGEVHEAGNYEQLMAARGLFHDLAKRQMA